jgi:hypothetical protein
VGLHDPAIWVPLAVAVGLGNRSLGLLPAMDPALGPVTAAVHSVLSVLTPADHGSR